MSDLGAPIEIPVPDIASRLEDYTVIQLESATSFGGSYALLTTITLFTDQTAYPYEDTAATATTWYRYRFYNPTGPVASSYCEPFPAQTAPTTTRQTLRQQAAEEVGWYLHHNGAFTFPGPSFTTTGTGSTTTVVCSRYIQAALSDDGTGTTSKRYDGWHLALTSGAASGEEAQISYGATTGYLNLTTGTFTVAPAFSAASGSGTTVEGYRYVPASMWNNFFEKARLDIWYSADVFVTGIASQTEYALPFWIETETQVLRIDHQYGSTIRQHSLAYGTDFTIEEQEGGGCVLRVPGGIGANSVYVVRAKRHPPAFTSDTAAVPLAEQFQRWVYLTAAMYAMKYLAQAPDRVVENTKQFEEKLAEITAEVKGLVRDLGTFRAQRGSRRTPMAAVTTWKSGY